MSFVVHSSLRRILYNCRPIVLHKPIRRTYLSNEYYCKDSWNTRLTTPILQKINLDDFYYELESAFQKHKNISAIDVDIFANAVTDDAHTEELLDLVHKLRLSADTSNALESTSHCVIRHLLDNKQYDRLNHVLNDRLNYGVFLDFYTANLILDTCWKNKDYCTGAKISSQLMLQEDFSNPLSLYLSLMHCFKYLQSKDNSWVVVKEEEDDSTEEIKVRVKFIQNTFFDDHFDLKEPLHLIGKTLWLAGCNINDPLGQTLHLVGLGLYEKYDKAKELVETFKKNNISIMKEGLALLPEDNEVRKLVEGFKVVDGSIESLLNDRIKELLVKMENKDISEQCKLYEEWKRKRLEILEEQKSKQEKVERLEVIKEQEKKLREKEMKLW